MIYKSESFNWFVAQKIDFSYFYIEKESYKLGPLDCVVSEDAPSLSLVVGSTALVEWSKE